MAALRGLNKLARLEADLGVLQQWHDGRMHVAERPPEQAASGSFRGLDRSVRFLLYPYKAPETLKGLHGDSDHSSAYPD
jgi:hypothetical protein